jgi:hypothetical protein
MAAEIAAENNAVDDPNRIFEIFMAQIHIW